MDRNQVESQLQNNSSQASNPSKLQEARFRKAMQGRIQNLTLSNIIGLSSTNKLNMQFNPVNGDLYYIAGSTIVVYNIEQNVQKKYIQSPNKRNIVSLAFSNDGRYLVAGEGTCKQPEIIIWDLYQATSNLGYEQEKPAKQLKGHKIGIKMLFFSPNMKYLVSIGDDNDKGLFVWDWMNEERITLNKMNKVPLSACFSNDGTKFVTCGEKQIKLWQFQPNGDIIKTPVKEKENAYIIEGKSISLGSKFVDKTFTDCEFDKESKYLYASTSTGQLCIFDETRNLYRWMDLKVQRIFNIGFLKEYVVCSCSDSYIRIFKTVTLDHKVTFPKIPPLLNYNIEKGQTKVKSQGGEYADAIGLVLDEMRGRVTTIFSDRSLFIWDVTQIEKVTMKRSFLNHSGGINDLQILNIPSSSEVTFFMTTSTDRTARIWHEIGDEVGVRRNAYSKNLSRIIYLTNDIESFKYKEENNSSPEEEDMNKDIDVKEFPTCIKSTKQEIILANNKGYLMFMNVNNFEVEHEIQAHDKEISCIDIIETPHHRLLATGGRDRQIKIFDLKNNYRHILTLDDHSSSIVGLKFALLQDTIYLVSAATDRQIIFREFKNNNFMTIHREVDKVNKINSLDLSSDQQTLFVGFDKKINSYSISTGKVVKSTETKEDEKVAKTYFDNLSILTDVSSSYIASFNQDKVIRIRDCQTMSIVSKAVCGDSVSGMGFTLNNNHLITSSSEGIIYIWKMSTDLKNNIEKKKQSLGVIAKKLQDFLKQDGQNLVNTKDWNLGSFWIEDEMRQYLQNQQKLNQNVPLQKEESTDPVLQNLKPADLMKNTNLPNWAKTKPQQNLNNNISPLQQQAPEKGKNNDDDNLLQDFKDRIMGENKIGGNFQNQKTNNFISDSEIIKDSLNMRQNSQFHPSQIAHAALNREQIQSVNGGFGLDSINERDYNDNDLESEDAVFTKSKKVASIIGYNNQPKQSKIEDASPNNNNNQQTKIDNIVNKYTDNAHPLYIDDNKVIGLKNNDEHDDSDDFEYNSEHISQFLKQDQSMPIGKTQAQLYSKLIGTKAQIQTNSDNKKEDDLKVEDIYNQENRKSFSNANSGQSNKTDKDATDIQYKKENGMVSLFNVDQIQGQLQKVENNLKQAENNFKFKDEHLNIFQSSNQPPQFMNRAPASHKFQSNLINSINMTDEQQQGIKEYEEIQKQDDGLIMLDDEDIEEEPVIKQFSKQSSLQKQGSVPLSSKVSSSLEFSISKPTINKDLQISQQSIGIDMDKIQIKDQSKQNTLRSGPVKQEFGSNNNINIIDEQKYENIKFNTLKNMEKKPSPTHQLVQQKEEDEVEIIHEEIIQNQSAASQEANPLHNLKQKKQWGVNDNKKSKEQERIFTDSKIQNIFGDANTLVQNQKNIYPLEEVHDEFDESYAVSTTKEYQQYQNEIDSSFKIILEQLGKIEEIVENKLDNEPVSLRKKVYEKIQLKANKVKASLQNINFKHQSSNQSNAVSQFNVSFLENDPVNKEMLENYSKLLLEAVLKRK